MKSTNHFYLEILHKKGGGGHATIHEEETNVSFNTNIELILYSIRTVIKVRYATYTKYKEPHLVMFHLRYMQGDKTTAVLQTRSTHLTGAFVCWI